VLADVVDDVDELMDPLGLDAAVRGGPSAGAAERQFAVRVPRGFANRIRAADPTDPILRQVLPIAAETEPVAGFTTDPVGEHGGGPGRGVLRKYHGRALLVVTGACAVHCRYCFRRHFPYGDRAISGDRWRDALASIRQDPSVTEVILSGGDPLTVPDDRLKGIAAEIAAVPHVRRLRIHTRMPIVLPQRVDGPLVEWLSGLRLPVVMVVHANHAQELGDEAGRSLAVLKRCGVTLLNQSVLLRGVNDSVEALCELSERLFLSGVLPYYLHLLDRVQGAAHFDISEAEATRIVAALRDSLPGYLVPRLVREVPGARSKVPVELR
jgi:EF-P beta-lysylation protein EpmB